MWSRLVAVTAVVVGGFVGLTNTEASAAPAAVTAFTTPATGIASITLDDGSLDQYQNARPALNAAGLHASFNIISDALDWVGTNMNATQAHQLLVDGHEIGNHTRDHTNLTTLSSAAIQAEFADAQNAIAARVGVTPTTCAYPNGASNSTIRSIAATFFAACRSTAGGRNSAGTLVPQNLVVYNVSTTTAASSITSAVNAAKAERSWVVFVYHHVGTITSTSDVSTSTFQAHLNAIKASGIDVRTVADAMSVMNGGGPAPSPTTTSASPSATSASATAAPTTTTAAPTTTTAAPTTTTAAPTTTTAAPTTTTAAPTTTTASPTTTSASATPSTTSASPTATPPASGGPLVSISLDDGKLDQYNNARPMLNTAGLRATFYIVSDAFDWVGTNMNPTQVHQLWVDGHEVGNHTRDHSDLTTLTTAGVQAEFADSQSAISSRAGVVPTTCAYPYGANNAGVRTVAAPFFKACRGTAGGRNVTTSIDKYNLVTYYVTTGTTAADITAEINAAKADKTWVVFVYHGVGTVGQVDDVTPTTFQSHLNAIKGSGVAVKPVGEAFAALTGGGTPNPAPTTTTAAPTTTTAAPTTTTAAPTTVAPTTTTAAPTTVAPTTTTAAPTTTAAAPFAGVASITLDDGRLDQYTNARPALNAAGLKATFYIVSDAFDWVGTNMNPTQVHQVWFDGHEIGNHTRDHSDLTTLTTAGIRSEFSDAQSAIVSRAQVPAPTSCAYPYGANNATVQSAASGFFKACRGTAGGQNPPSALAKYNLVVYYVTTGTTAANITAAANAAKANKQWVVFVYHGVGTVGQTEDVTPATFQAHLTALKATGISVQTVGQALTTLGA